jgi:hypothetical protein
VLGVPELGNTVPRFPGVVFPQVPCP